MEPPAKICCPRGYECGVGAKFLGLRGSEHGATLGIRGEPPEGMWPFSTLLVCPGGSRGLPVLSLCFGAQFYNVTAPALGSALGHARGRMESPWAGGRGQSHPAWCAQPSCSGRQTCRARRGRWESSREGIPGLARPSPSKRTSPGNVGSFGVASKSTTERTRLKIPLP